MGHVWLFCPFSLADAMSNEHWMMQTNTYVFSYLGQTDTIGVETTRTSFTRFLSTLGMSNCKGIRPRLSSNSVGSPVSLPRIGPNVMLTERVSSALRPTQAGVPDRL